MAVATSTAKSKGIDVPEELKTATVKDIMQRMSLFLCFIPDESSESRLLAEGSEKVLAIIRDCISANEGVAGKSVSLISAPSLTSSPNRSAVVGTSSPSSSVPNCDEAWSVLQNPGKMKDPQALASVLSDLGVESAVELQLLSIEELASIAECLKPVGARAFRSALLLSP